MGIKIGNAGRLGFRSHLGCSGRNATLCSLQVCNRMNKKERCLSVATLRLVTFRGLIPIFRTVCPTFSHWTPTLLFTYLEPSSPPYSWLSFSQCFSTAKVMTERLERSICVQKWVVYPSSPCKTHFFPAERRLFPGLFSVLVAGWSPGAFHQAPWCWPLWLKERLRDHSQGLLCGSKWKFHHFRFHALHTGNE